MNPEFPILVAQAAPASGGSPFGTIAFMLALGLIFYAIIIYPQNKQKKEHAKMLSEIERGDQVVTSGGIHGKVTGISDDLLTVEIADRVRVKLNKSAVTNRILAAPAAKSAKDGKKA